MLLDMVQAMSTVKYRFMNSRLLRTVCFAPGERKLYTLSLINPPLVPAISVNPSLALLTGV